VANAWIEYQLDKPQAVDEVVLKLIGWRLRSYPLRITMDGVTVYEGVPAKSLGYVTLPLKPVKGSRPAHRPDRIAHRRPRRLRQDRRDHRRQGQPRYRRREGGGWRSAGDYRGGAASVPFPLNIRALQAGWKLLFFKPGRFEPDKARSAAWNRGAYLAEGVSHCGACHTPRNALGAEKRDKAFAGAPIDNWIAPPLTAANPSPAPWDQAELTAYLRTGLSRYHGVAAGPMAPVVHDGLSRLPDADIQALAVYFADRAGAAGRVSTLAPALQRAAVADRLNVGPQTDPSARLYTAACASCHYNGAGQPNPLRPDLALNSAVNLDDPTNLIRVVLYGVSARDGAPGVVMPSFNRFSDADVARLAAYLRATRTDKPAWPGLDKKVAAIRAQGK
jgi:mono/diheme cytochrome c family protein